MTTEEILLIMVLGITVIALILSALLALRIIKDNDNNKPGR